jgi:MFS transporter, DHA1 family, multidrug resistance protein
MSVSTGDRTAGPLPSARRVGTSVFLNYLFSNLGYYTLLPILPLLLTRLPGATSWSIGTALFTLTFSLRAACLTMSGLMHRSSIRVAAPAGLVVAAAGFAGLALVHSPAGALVCLAVAGSGASVNTVMVRAYVAVALPATGARNTAFSVIQIGVNLAAAVGPIAANLLFSSGLQSICLLIVAALYAAGAAAVALIVPGGIRPSRADPRPATTRNALRAVAASPQVRYISVITVAGWFLYGQLFSAMTLHIDAVTAAPLARSAFFITNAAVVALVQVPVSAYAARRLGTGTTAVAFLLAGLTVFAAAFCWMALLGGGVAGTFGGVAVFSLAETLFTPFVSTAFAGIAANRPVIEAFALLQIGMAIGEPLGSFSGGALYSALNAAGLGALYWAGLSAGALGIVIAARRWSPRRAPVPAPAGPKAAPAADAGTRTGRQGSCARQRPGQVPASGEDLGRR